jgi:ubiquitin carboxyl-terminal hydrolase 8
MNIYTYDFHTHHELSLKKECFIKKGLCGLINQGNTCFLNSILQCLSNTLKLTDYFLSGKLKEDDPEELNKRKHEYYLVLSYINLLNNIWETNQVLRPKSFFENLSKFIKKYFTLEQQDSHECLMYILDILHRGMSYEIEVDIKGEPQNESDVLIKKSLEQWKIFYKDNYSFIIETFNGMFYNKINCVNCDYKDTVFEPFNCISIDIPDCTSTKLTHCLESYFNTNEHIDSWKCESCKKNGCSKNINLWSLPNYIIIHLKRFTNNGKKIETHIDFPIDDLNISQFISTEKGDPNNYIYSCYAINYHNGDLNGGHYWSSCKNLNNHWYTFNDANVSKVTDLSSLTKNAYLMFFHRKFIKTPIQI